MGNRRRTLVAIVLLIIAVASLFVYVNIQSNVGKLASIEVAYSPFESLGLFWVAQEQGFFSQNSLNITVHKYDTGAGALNGVINGEADIAVGTTEFPFVINALDQESIQTIGSISKSNFIYIVGRSDRGITDASNLEGKIIGTTFGTIAHYYLGRFLALNNIKVEDVDLVDLKTPTEWVNAVVNGSVDAVATAQPYANLAKEGLGTNAVVWSIHSNQPLYAQAIATSEWIADNPELCRRFIKSLHQAEQFIIDHSSEAKLILKQQMNISDAYFDIMWSQNEFSLSLDQSLILAMESEARWLINNNLTQPTLIPDFRDNLHIDALLSVKPGSVNVVLEEIK